VLLVKLPVSHARGIIMIVQAALVGSTCMKKSVLTSVLPFTLRTTQQLMFVQSVKSLVCSAHLLQPV